MVSSRGSNTARAPRALDKSLGFSRKLATPVLRRLQDKNWELMEDESYRALNDAQVKDGPVDNGDQDHHQHHSTSLGVRSNSDNEIDTPDSPDFRTDLTTNHSDDSPSPPLVVHPQQLWLSHLETLHLYKLEPLTMTASQKRRQVMDEDSSMMSSCESSSLNLMILMHQTVRMPNLASLTFRTVSAPQGFLHFLHLIEILNMFQVLKTGQLGVAEIGKCLLCLWRQQAA